MAKTEKKPRTDMIGRIQEGKTLVRQYAGKNYDKLFDTRMGKAQSKEEEARLGREREQWYKNLTGRDDGINK